MKKIFRVAVLNTAVAVFVLLCGIQMRTAIAHQVHLSKPYEVPCTIYDNSEQFAATGINKGFQKRDVKLYAISEARQKVYEKFYSAYHMAVSDYIQCISDKIVDSTESKLYRAADMISMGIRIDCEKYSPEDSSGIVTCFVGVTASKAELAEQVTDAVSEILTPDEKEAIGFDVCVFRKQMQERMAEYKEQK